jgi:replicative DNA helicase
MANELIDVEIESSAIGAMIANDTGATVAVADYGITPDMFAVPVHRSLVKNILDIAQEKKGYVDPLLLANRLRTLGVLDELPGGIAYVYACADKCPVAFHAPAHFDKIRDLYYKRQVVDTCNLVQQEAKTTTAGSEYLATVPQKFYDLMPKVSSKKTVAQCMSESREKWRKIDAGEITMPGLPSGFAEIDAMLGGFQKGFHIIAARPSAGKTSLEGCILTHLAKNNVPVARVCMDMSMEALLERDICRQSSVSLPKLNAHHAGEKNLSQVDAAIDEINQWPMHILAGEYDITRIASWLRLMKLRHDIKLASIDYIQLCSAEHIRSYDPVRVIGYCSAVVKALAAELDIPVIVLAQLNRDSAKDRRRPTLADLKGCGDLEQHAQTCILLSKEERFDYYRHHIDEKRQRAIWCDVAKNQQGGVGASEMWFHAPYFKMSFAPIDWGYKDPLHTTKGTK